MPASGQPTPHIDDDALTRSLDGLIGLDAGDRASGNDGLVTVVRAAAALFTVSGVGLMLIGEDQVLRYVAASDPRAALLERAQEELGYGPCVDSFVNETIVATPDLLADARWPQLGERLSDRGVRAVLGTPTRLGATVVGSLNVYRDEPYDWDESDVAAVGAYNRVIESQLAWALAAGRQDRLIAQLEHALADRVRIERAIGVLMGLEGLDPVAAFNRLRSTARGERRRVLEVATEVLDGRRLPA